MLKLKFKNLNDENFSKALAKISVDPGWATFQAAYNVSKILRRIKNELTSARETHLSILKNYAKTDENGGFLTHKSGGFPFEIKEDLKEEYETKMKEFLETEVELDCTTIKANDIGSVKLTPSEIDTLSPIIEI